MGTLNHGFGPLCCCFITLFGARGIQDACLPIVYVPVHIVMGMPMTVGMGMPMALTMGTKNHIIDIAYGLHYGHARLAQQIT